MHCVGTSLPSVAEAVFQGQEISEDQKSRGVAAQRQAAFSARRAENEAVILFHRAC